MALFIRATVATLVFGLGGCSADNGVTDERSPSSETGGSSAGSGADGSSMHGAPGEAGGGGGGSAASGGGGSGTGGRDGGGGAGRSGAGGGAGEGGGGGGGPVQCNGAAKPGLPIGAPKLTLGDWTNISPAGVPFDANASAVTQGMAIDPCDPAVLYVCIGSKADPSLGGIYKTIDGGSTWRSLGQLKNTNHVRVDPRDAHHLYATDGVNGSTNGFWVSHDAGETWTMTEGFKSAASSVHSTDTYQVVADPADFAHVLVSFHSYWFNGDTSGIFESFDGGTTFTIHDPIPGVHGAGGYGVFFLSSPALGIGDSKTWLFGTQGAGYYRTTDAGKTWSKVTDNSMTHGGGQLYYTKSGVLYAGGVPQIMKSTDNGASWTMVGPNGGYIGLVGDGTHLYTGAHDLQRPIVTALEADGVTWGNYGAQEFRNGPFELVFDSTNGIVYAASVNAGVWALKVKP